MLHWGPTQAMNNSFEEDGLRGDLDLDWTGLSEESVLLVD